MPAGPSPSQPASTILWCSCMVAWATALPGGGGSSCSGWGMSGAGSRGQQGTTAVPSGQLCSGLDQRRRLRAAAFARACRVWHARGQGFKSPQLHQAQRHFHSRSEHHLPEILPETRAVAVRTLAVLSGSGGPRGPLGRQAGEGRLEIEARDGREHADEDLAEAQGGFVGHDGHPKGGVGTGSDARQGVPGSSRAASGSPGCVAGAGVPSRHSSSRGSPGQASRRTWRGTRRAA